jgi:hypothetical protein
MKSTFQSCTLLAFWAVSSTAAQGFNALNDKVRAAAREGAGDVPVAVHEGTGRVLVTDSLDRGLTLLHADGSDPIRVTGGTNAGYGASISPDGRYVCYKGFKDSSGARLQAALIFDIEAGEIVNLSGWRPRVGTPSMSPDGKVGFTIGRMLHILDAGWQRVRTVELEGTANLIGFSPDGRRVAYPDEEARLRVLELAEGKDVLLTLDGRGFWGPAFSPDGARLLASTADGDVAVIPSAPGGTLAFLSDEARDGDPVPFSNLDKRSPAYLRNPIWLDDKTVALVRIPAVGDTRTDRQFLSFDLSRKAGGRLRASAPLPAEDGRVLIGRTSLFRMQRRVLVRAPLDRASPAPTFRWNSVGAALPGRLKVPPRATPRESGRVLIAPHLAKAGSAERDSVMIPDVPYLSQTHDTRDGWNGHSSCGATSAIMTLAYYGLLAKRPLTVKKGSTHVTDFGFYITEKYTVGNTTFNIGSKDPDGKTGYGGFGYITKNNWADTKGSMAAYLRIHGAKSEVDWSTTLAEVKREIDARHPLVVLNALTSSGHYIAAIGYFKGALDGTVIFNDPYGDRNDATYNSYRGGIRVYYDMPGENNGYANLKNAGCFIYSRAERAVTSLEQRPDPALAGPASNPVHVNILGAVVPAGRRSSMVSFPAAPRKRASAEGVE